MLKAIETRHNGYRFRSRLEARWAVFMDTLGVKYEYEYEGFELPGGLRYLPDFWLPGQRCWVEVKPGKPDDIETAKARALVSESSRPLFVVSTLEEPEQTSRVANSPVLNSHIGFIPHVWFGDDPQRGVFQYDNCCWVTCAKCGAVSFADSTDTWFAQQLAHGGYRDCGHMEFLGFGRVTRAFHAARSARFEHGQ